MTGHQMGMSMEMEAAISDTTECARICAQTTSHCLSLGGRHAEAGHISLLMDCETICGITALYLARGSTFHPQLCVICADICRACAESCMEIDPSNSMMMQCADACRACAESCGIMARMRRAA